MEISSSSVDVRFVIFSGANERAVIACCRHFSKKNINFSIISRPVNDIILLSKYRKNVDSSRKSDSLLIDDMARCVTEIRDMYPSDNLIFLPTTESIIRVVLENKNLLTSKGLDIHLVDLDVYLNISEKSLFLNYARKFSIDIPRELISPKISDIPFVAKPKAEFSSKNNIKIYPKLVFNEIDLQDIVDSEYKDDYFFQSYIDGNSYYYLIFVCPDGICDIAYQKNLLQQGNGKSIIAAELCECPDRVFEDKIISLLNSLGFFGFIMVEVMQHKGITYLIEANPRLWGPFDLALKAGLLPENIFFKRITGLKYKKAKYIWLTGLIDSLSRKDNIRNYIDSKSKIYFIFSFILSDFYFKLDTIGIFLHEVKMSFRNFFAR
ncbi:hypothetical protein H0248_06400 [Pectobacterium brasiliense]|uniref:hypothetical protein n=1 Tax=Pectobacterium brasiliense TaxID=180957 RepID=UPI0015DF2A94|nr:hypothetical protein [Pectobacterium brasiliense]MBA0216997.1 hypothetical protein [Pectobacterium brasiliense]